MGNDMDMTKLDFDRLQEMMGDTATRADAECMMAILSRECVGDTDDVSDEQWQAWCGEAYKRADHERRVADEYERAAASE
jgi:hypothetical protein